MKVHRSVLTLTAGHFFIDKYSNMFGAYLPFMQQKIGLTLAQAGLLGGMLAFSSALMQPLYGYLSDRFQSRLIVALSPAVAGIFMSMVGLAPDFPTLLVLLLLAGIGIAAFHPQGAALTAEAADERHAFQMSFFISGGMLGYALGPTFITSLILLVGLERSYWAALPGILISAYLLASGPSPRRFEHRARRREFGLQLRTSYRPLLILYSLVVIRSSIQIAFVSFLPLYLTLGGMSEARASQTLTVFLLFGGTAGLLGGVLADRLGGRLILAGSMLGTLPFLIGFLWTEGIASLVFCALGGGFLLSTAPVNVVLAQRLVPQGSSTVSALMMGFGWGMGGLMTPVVGWISEFVGLQWALTGTVLLALPGFGLSFLIPHRFDSQAPDRIRAIPAPGHEATTASAPAGNIDRRR